MTDHFVAPSLLALDKSVDKEFPHRDHSSDGFLGDASHAARPSEHNPCWTCTGYQYGIIRAGDWDIDDGDPGRDLRKELLNSCIGHDAVWYVISNGIIYSRTHGWAAMKYTGPNAHTKHVHVSINKNEASAKNLTLKLKTIGKPPTGSRPPTPPKPSARQILHPSRIRNCASGFALPESDPAFAEVTGLMQWFIALTKEGGKPILFQGGVETWQRAVRQKQYAAAGKYLKSCIVNYQKRYGLVADGIFGPKSATIAGGKTGRFTIVGK